MSGVQVTAKVVDGKVRQSLRALGDVIPKVGRRRLKQILQSAKYEASGGWNGGNSYSMAGAEKPSYQRTGTYGESYKIVDNGAVSYTLQSDAVQDGQHYTPFVGGNAAGTGQAFMHIGRWPLIGPTVEKWLRALVDDIEQDLSQFLRAQGIGM
jgi:hypothetical protein